MSKEPIFLDSSRPISIKNAKMMQNCLFGRSAINNPKESEGEQVNREGYDGLGHPKRK
jgi:hypothetical protein